MENFVTLEMWAVLAAAPCFLAWLLGTLHGEARMRRAFAFTDIAAHQTALRLANADDDDESDRIINEISDQPSDHAPLYKPDLTSPEREHPHGASVLDDLRAHTENIRLSAKLWDDPEILRELHHPDPVADQVLSHYRGSIDTLEEANAERRLRDPVDARISAELLNAKRVRERAITGPRLTDVAPLTRDIWETNSGSISDCEDFENESYLTVRRA